jgi:hypothetical protein
MLTALLLIPPSELKLASVKKSNFQFDILKTFTGVPLMESPTGLLITE